MRTKKINIKVNNLESPRSGNPVANQYEIESDEFYIFQSYGSIIAYKERGSQGKIVLDRHYWDYSRTTLKYLKQFLGVNLSKKEIEGYIKQGIYKTNDLNIWRK
jgi:hypothetical protein